CRVLQEGTVRQDSKITLLERPSNNVSVLFSNEIYFHNRKDKDGIAKVLAVQELAEIWRGQLEDRLSKLK
ncbi:3-alpha domain-containing protein, partial [Peribacillus sp. SIMBA_075]